MTKEEKILYDNLKQALIDMEMHVRFGENVSPLLAPITDGIKKHTSLGRDVFLEMEKYRKKNTQVKTTSEVKEIKDMTRDELLALADALNLEGYKRMKKSTLIELCENAAEEQALQKQGGE